MTAAGLEVVLIAAVAEDGTIGDEGAIPWHHPEDLRRFKETTMGAPVVMGRRTYESIVGRLGHALPGRTNVVLSRRAPDDVIAPGHRPDGETAIVVVDGLERAFDAAREAGDVAYVAGGRQVYDQSLSHADRLLITEVPGRYGGDTRFPTLGDRWREVDREQRGELAFVTYVRAV